MKFFLIQISWPGLTSIKEKNLSYNFIYLLWVFYHKKSRIFSFVDKTLFIELHSNKKMSIIMFHTMKDAYHAIFIELFLGNEIV